MRSTFSLLTICSTLLIACHSPKVDDRKPSDEFDKKASELLAQMTLEEKVGQMTQINFDAIAVGEIYNLVEPHTLDTAKLRNIIRNHFVGSILNVGGHSYSREKWLGIIGQVQAEAAKTRLKIPVIYGIDGIHGVNYTSGATLFPQQIAQAATWNTALVERGAEITAYETRASGIPWNFSPVLGLGRQPLWSRLFETYGEDTYLAARMGEACIRGYEGNDISSKDRIASCMKHFLGYSVPLTGKDRTPVYLHERQIRELLLPTFKAAVDAGSHTVMINSGEINGIPVHADPEILVDLLRDELGFEGLAVTDWEDIMKLNTLHRVASTQKEAVKIAINAGIDMSMVPNDLKFFEYLVELVNEGEVPMSRIDESVTRILKVKMQLGLFENPGPPALEDYPEFGSAEFQNAAYETAVESMTLLKNENATLPLDPSKRVLVVGAASNSKIMLNGAWSHTWQGNDAKYDTEIGLTVKDAMTAVNPNTMWAQGSTINELVNDGAENMARTADHIVVCLGEAPSTEKPGDIADLNLEDAQKELVRKLAKSGKPMTFVLVLNRPRIISDIETMADAILMAYLPGDQGGKAIADVIYGKRSPSGKLPYTYPRSTGDFTKYDHVTTERLDPGFGMKAFNPQFEFGQGMSYADLSYGSIEMNDTIYGMNDTLAFSVVISNASKQAVKEAVPVFVRDEIASITPAEKKLRAFTKVEVPANGSATVAFSIPVQELAFVGIDLEYVLEPGAFALMVGDQKMAFHVKEAAAE